MWDVDVESLACPVSVITEESKDTVRRFFDARLTAKIGGAMYGPDASLWPARWFEAVTLIQNEIQREETAMHLAFAAKQR